MLHKSWIKFAALLIALCMTLTFMSFAAFAEDGGTIDNEGNEETEPTTVGIMPVASTATFDLSTGKYVGGATPGSDANALDANKCWLEDDTFFWVTDGADVTITGTSVNGSTGKGVRRVVVSGTATITLDDATIICTESEQSPILLNSGANLALTLEGVNILTAGTGRAGLQAERGTILTISGSGTLTASGGINGAGIGGGDGGDGGEITIGADAGVYADGGIYGAGIGGGYYGNGGTITINGGNVTADGGNYAADIGGGGGGDVDSDIIINVPVNADNIGPGDNGAIADGGSIDMPTPAVTFTPQGVGIDLQSLTSLEIEASDASLLARCTFDSVQFKRSDGMLSTILYATNSYGLTFGWSGGVLTIPAGVFSAHGNNTNTALQPGSYTALITFKYNNLDVYFDYESDPFTLTGDPLGSSGGGQQPKPPEPPKPPAPAPTPTPSEPEPPKPAPTPGGDSDYDSDDDASDSGEDSAYYYVMYFRNISANETPFHSTGSDEYRRTVTVTGREPAREGYRFLRWTQDAAGRGEAFEAGGRARRRDGQRALLRAVGEDRGRARGREQSPREREQ